MRLHRLLVIASASALAMACGDDGSGPTDTGARDAADAADAGPGLVTPPAPPASPGLTPCDRGWREVDEDGLARCEPWPETGPADCAAGEAHFPGEAGCAPVGDACPADGWPTAPASSGAVHHVDPTAPPGGDGTMAAPHATIAAAMGAASSGDVVALKAGDYDEVVSIRSGVAVVGACASGVRLGSTESNARAGIVVVQGASTELRNVTVGPAQRAGITLDRASSEISLTGVVIEGVWSAGIRATGGAVDATRVVVKDTVGDASGVGGWGLLAEDGATVEITDGVFERNLLAGIAVIREGTTARLVNVHVADSVPSGGVFGRGLDVEMGGAVELEAVVLEGNTEYNLYVSNDGSHASGRQLVSRGGIPNGDGTLGIGIAVNDAATAALERVFVDDNVDTAVVVDELATLTLTDALLTDTASAPDGYLGRGFNVEDGASLEVTRAIVARSSDVGLAVRAAEVTATDVVVRDTRPRGLDDDFGMGAQLERGARMTLERVAFVDNLASGLVGFDASSRLVASDVLVDGVTSAISDGRLGRGISLQEGIVAELARVEIRDVQDLGLVALFEDTRVTAVDLRIAGVSRRACASTTCSAEPFGSGVASVDRAAVALDAFVVEDGELCGTHVVGDASMDLTNGRVAGWQIGACIQVEGFDQSRLSNDVDYVDNETNLTATELPVPDSNAASAAL